MGRPEEIEQLVLMQLPQILETFQETIVAEFRSTAAADAATAHAEAQCRRVLDLLRYAIPTIYPGASNVVVGIQGEVPSQARARVALAISSDGERFTWQLQNAEARTPFVLSPENVARMTELGIFEVSQILEKPDTAVERLRAYAA